MPADGLRHRARDSIVRLGTRLRVDAVARALDARRGGAVRVMVLHGTPARHAAAFEAQVRWVRDHFALLDPREYLEILDGQRRPPSRPAVVFTFDDGLASNAEIAAPILEAYGTRGMFFACPGFAELEGAAAHGFFAERVRFLDDPAGFTSDDVTPMTPATLRRLHERGHVIGNHTRSHQDLGTVSAAVTAAEIEGARDVLGGWIGADVTSFAWTFAWNAITVETWAAALDTHRYCFTACPGRGALGPGCVWRTNVEADVDPAMYPFFYSGLADPIWWSRRRRLRALHHRVQVRRARP